MKTGQIDRVKVKLTVVLGEKELYLADVAGIGEGSIIELDKLAGEPVDLLANGEPIAKGEVVVIDQYFGVRVTYVLDEKGKSLRHTDK